MTMKQTKPLSTQKIQAVLRKAGYKSYSAGGGMGYAVRPRPGWDGQWIVEPLGMPAADGADARTGYRAALSVAGLDAQEEELRWGAAVIIRDQTEGGA